VAIRRACNISSRDGHVMLCYGMAYASATLGLHCKCADLHGSVLICSRAALRGFSKGCPRTEKPLQRQAMILEAAAADEAASDCGGGQTRNSEAAAEPGLEPEPEAPGRQQRRLRQAMNLQAAVGAGRPAAQKAVEPKFAQPVGIMGSPILAAMAACCCWCSRCSWMWRSSCWRGETPCAMKGDPCGRWGDPCCMWAPPS
jgi:hypothetical protein